MMDPYGLLGKSLVLAGGLWWLIHVWNERHERVQAFRAGDATTRGVLILIWSVTALIFLLVSGIVWTLVRDILHGLRLLFA